MRLRLRHRGTPLLRHHAAGTDRDARLCFDPRPGIQETTALTAVLEEVKRAHHGGRVVLTRDGLPTHRSRAMHDRLAEQDWLTMEPVPAHATEINRVEMLWAGLRNAELADLAGEQSPADTAHATRSRITRIRDDDQLPWPSSPTPDRPSTPALQPTKDSVGRDRTRDR